VAEAEMKKREQALSEGNGNRPGSR
jgi:hypothetical protein